MVRKITGPTIGVSVYVIIYANPFCGKLIRYHKDGIVVWVGVTLGFVLGWAQPLTLVVGGEE